MKGFFHICGTCSNIVTFSVVAREKHGNDTTYWRYTTIIYGTE